MPVPTPYREPDIYIDMLKNNETLVELARQDTSASGDFYWDYANGFWFLYIPGPEPSIADIEHEIFVKLWKPYGLQCGVYLCK